MMSHGRYKLLLYNGLLLSINGTTIVTEVLGDHAILAFLIFWHMPLWQ